ncbi:MAG: signal peptide peptidase SppA [Alphaproteobacteria bacterium]|nr:signal peptide peptidase SppA [Alphaproteobacteria bacterium]
MSAVLIYISLPAEPTIAEMPDKMVLYMELDGGLDDLPEEINFLDPFSVNNFTVRDFIDALEHAKTDKRVKGIYAKMRKGTYSLAHIQEIRQGLKNFRESGKFAYIYSTSFADGLGAYYFASAFDEIWMQPMGVLAITGINAEVPFFAQALEKIGVETDFYQREDYKTAYESFTNSQISPENKEMTQRLVRNIAESLQEEIAQDREITATDFKTLVDRGLFVDYEALDAGLVDFVSYEDEIITKINVALTGKKKPDQNIYVNFNSYIHSLKADNPFIPSPKLVENSHKPSVALIYAVGAIIDTDDNMAHASKVNMTNDGTAAADEISKALYEAGDDPNIVSIVLRVNSPGGSPVASETILRAVEQARKKGKKVYVSMGPAAASGGYWIAANADRIFALPTTLTGSIGVLGGKVSLNGLWKKVGINWERIGWGQNSAMWSMNSKFSKSEAERMNTMLDNIYINFLDRVSKGRGIPVSDLRKIAGGRVWLGKTALELGLVDELGSLNDTLDYAAREAGLKNRYDINIRIMPKPLTPLEQFISLLEGQASAGQSISVLSKLIQNHVGDLNSLIVTAHPDEYTVYQPIKVQ